MKRLEQGKTAILVAVNESICCHGADELKADAAGRSERDGCGRLDGNGR
jgi:hypothetical protein